MKVLVCGASGCVGRAVVHALKARGHQVVSGGRQAAASPAHLQVDFNTPLSPQQWATRLASLHLDAVVNCAGILMETPGQRFEQVHHRGPVALFQGAALAGVAKVVQVSALGVGEDDASLAMPYLRSKLQADDALASLPVDWAVLRPALVVGPHCPSTRLFASLAALPVVSLPGKGDQALQAVHVFDLAEAVVRVLERREPTRAVLELAGPATLTYRGMLQQHRQAQGLGEPLWLPLPMALMWASAWAAEALPQRVLCRDTIRLLQRGSLPTHNALPGLLRRAPMGLAQGLECTPVAPWLRLSASLAPALEHALRLALAAMWWGTALVSFVWRDASGVMALLAQCGFHGALAQALWAGSSVLNLWLGWRTLHRPTAVVYALQAAAIAGYTGMAAWHQPSMLLEHGAPLVKNLPALAVVLTLWLALAPTRPAAHPARGRRQQASLKGDQPRLA